MPTCCYARSDKYWTTDPQGIAWETFHTLDAIPVFGETNREQTRACCDAAPIADTAASKTSACCSLIGDLHETGNFERSVSLHRQLGAQHHGGVDLELDRHETNSKPLAQEAIRPAASIRWRSNSWRKTVSRPRVCAARTGANSPVPARRSCISSSRCAIRPRRRPARSGPANR